MDVEVLNALDKIVSNLDDTSDEDLQAKLEKCKGGLVGKAIAGSEDLKSKDDKLKSQLDEVRALDRY